VGDVVVGAPDGGDVGIGVGDRDGDQLGDKSGLPVGDGIGASVFSRMHVTVSALMNATPSSPIETCNVPSTTASVRSSTRVSSSTSFRTNNIVNDA
jgi:hypothetical protein